MMRAGALRAARFAPLLFVLLASLLLGVVTAYELEPAGPDHAGAPVHWDRLHNDRMLGGLSALTALSLVAYGLLRRRPFVHSARVQGLLFGGIAALTLVSGGLYFYGARGSTDHPYAHVHDAYHYYIGPKYFRELGYFDLYHCTVAALDTRLVPNGLKVRKLSDYSMTKAGKVRDEYAQACRTLFGKERFAAFQSDLYALADANRGAVRSGLGDLGYNGSPFHTFVASTLADLWTAWAPLSYAKINAMPLLDVFGLCAMLAAFVVCFGWRVGLLASLFGFTAIVDRHYIIGGSFLRYAWLCTLGLGVAALKRRRHATAGVLLAVSSALNVFPVLFAAAVPLKALWELLRQRRLRPEYRRYLVAFAIAGAACLGLGATRGQGADNYAGFIQDMQLHSVASRIPGFGVGLKFDLLYRGEHKKNEYKKSRKIAELRRLRPILYSAAGLLMTLTLCLLPRLDDVEGTTLLGFCGVFCLFGPTAYYYAFSPLLILMWHRRTGEGGAYLLLTSLFVCSVIAYVALEINRNVFMVFNSVVSATWTIYLVAALSYLAVTTGLAGALAKRFAAG